MITPATADALSEVIERAEQAILDRMAENRLRQEPDITSRLMRSIEIYSETVEGISIALETVDGLGPDAAENAIGADVLGSIRIAVGGVRASKGFLIQAKMAGKDRLKFRPSAADDGRFDVSHTFNRGPLNALGSDEVYPLGSASGTVSITQTSRRLEKQCDDMLRLTPASFVLVLGRDQIGVVSAAAVRAHRKAAQRVPHDLGTKTLTDFFLNLADCFIGDDRLGSTTQDELVARAALMRIPTGLSVRISDRSGQQG